MPRLVRLLCTLAAALVASATAATEVELRFHPSRQLWAYELEAARQLGSVTLPNAVVANPDGDPVQVVQVRYELLFADRVGAARVLAAEDLDAIAARAGALAASGMMAALDFQFSPKTLLAGDLAIAAGRELGPGKALHLPTQFLGFSGKPDALRVTATLGDGSEASATVPIRHGGAGPYRFPLHGRWFVAAGATPHSHHRWAVPEEFALDLVQIGKGGRTHSGSGSRMRDYYAYRAPVLAVADGEVVAVHAGEPDNTEILRRRGESLSEYQQRVLAGQGDLLARGTDAIVGNHVVLRHADGIHSVYAHLAPGTIAVAKGQQVRAGERIALLGSSGNSTEPHLHFHLCDAPDALRCAGIPPTFSDIEMPYTDFPRQLQTGDLVDAGGSATD